GGRGAPRVGPLARLLGTFRAPGEEGGETRRGGGGGPESCRQCQRRGTRRGALEKISSVHGVEVYPHPPPAIRREWPRHRRGGLSGGARRGPPRPGSGLLRAERRPPGAAPRQRPPSSRRESQA